MVGRGMDEEGGRGGGRVGFLWGGGDGGRGRMRWEGEGK